MSFLSKTKMSKCYYCGEVMRDENLKTHCKKAHKAAKRVAGERSVEGFFASPFQPKVSKTSTESSASTSGEILLSTGGRQTPEDLLLTGPPSHEELQVPVDLVDMFEDDTVKSPVEPKDALEENTVNELVTLVKDIAEKSGESSTEIKFLRESIETLVSKLEKKVPEFAKPDETSPSDERVELLHRCKTVDDIVEIFDELVVEKETDIVFCELCYIEKESVGAKKPGQFKYEKVEQNDDDGENLQQSRSFRNLKIGIKKHFQSTLHNDNWKVWKAKEDAKEVFKKREYEVGMRIARISYAGYKAGSSKRNFEQ